MIQSPIPNPQSPIPNPQSDINDTNNFELNFKKIYIYQKITNLK